MHGNRYTEHMQLLLGQRFAKYTATAWRMGQFKVEYFHIQESNVQTLFIKLRDRFNILEYLNMLFFTDMYSYYVLHVLQTQSRNFIGKGYIYRGVLKFCNRHA
jgi:hypothetical protein